MPQGGCEHIVSFGLAEYLAAPRPFAISTEFRKYCTSPECDPKTTIKGKLKQGLKRDVIVCPDCGYSLYTEYKSVK